VKSIIYLKGDATNPIDVDGNKILIHCCNNLGLMGAGIAKTIREKWPNVYEKYREWSRKPDFNLEEVQFVKVAGDLVVANMIGQEGVGFTNGKPPVRYDAIDSCLKKVAEVALKHKASVVGPRICAGLAGGDWNKIEAIIIENLCKKDISVYIYDLV
jgi:O-acetyl-ADP-ribose deacetylase (regulator of RNase III)